MKIFEKNWRETKNFQKANTVDHRSPLEFHWSTVHFGRSTVPSLNAIFLKIFEQDQGGKGV